MTTSAPSMRTAFGAKEELRAGLEMKPIMGFLNICFILALNARPPDPVDGMLLSARPQTLENGFP